MRLKTLHALTSLQVKSVPNAVPKIFLDKIRKNLMTLICQADIAELTGDLNAFGGEKDVASNISKAVFGLFCLGSVFGVSVSEAIERYAADVTKRLAAGQTAEKEPQPQSEKREDKHDSTAPQEGGKQSPDPAPTGAKPTKDSAQSAKEETTKSYDRKLRDAKTLSELNSLWKKEIVPDQSLQGKDKAPLSKVFEECKKRLKGA